MNAHLAHESRRGFVFPYFEWEAKHYPWKFYDDELADRQWPPHTPLNALLSGPVAGGSWDWDDDTPRHAPSLTNGSTLSALPLNDDTLTAQTSNKASSGQKGTLSLTNGPRRCATGQTDASKSYLLPRTDSPKRSISGSGETPGYSPSGTASPISRSTTPWPSAEGVQGCDGRHVSLDE